MRRFKILLFLFLLLFLGLWFALTRRHVKSAEEPQSAGSHSSLSNQPIVFSPSTNPSPSRPDTPLGTKLLLGYADASFPPEHDLTLMSHLMENSLLLAKSAANRSLSANEDWADFLRGKNAAHERFLPDEHPALNAKGQLIDRWGTLLFFHALGGSRFEIRSAGPDRKLWTADDIHRNSDGTFRHGADLNPTALYGGTNPGNP